MRRAETAKTSDAGDLCVQCVCPKAGSGTETHATQASAMGRRFDSFGVRTTTHATNRQRLHPSGTSWLSSPFGATARRQGVSTSAVQEAPAAGQHRARCSTDGGTSVDMGSPPINGCSATTKGPRWIGLLKVWVQSLIRSPSVSRAAVSTLLSARAVRSDRPSLAAASRALSCGCPDSGGERGCPSARPPVCMTFRPLAA